MDLNKMNDIFENDILCRNCKKKMEKSVMSDNGFKIRFVQCGNCGEKVYHPGDIQEYKQFSDLKQKQFRVKLRLVGNSYAVSIPKEIVDFIKGPFKNKQEQDSKIFDQQKDRKSFAQQTSTQRGRADSHSEDDIFNNMVNLCFEEMNRISLMFDDLSDDLKNKRNKNNMEFEDE